jgi:hypothetical protein
VTFVAVVVAWVFFRADSFATANTVLHGMTGAYGLKIGESYVPLTSIGATNTLIFIVFGLAICWLMPNSQQFVRAFRPAYQKVAEPEGWSARLVWQPVRAWSWLIFGVVLALGLLRLSPTRVSEFLYYQF